VSLLQQKEAREGEGDVQGGESVASDAGEVGCDKRVSVVIMRLKKTRTLIHDVKHRYQVLVFRLRDELDDAANVVDYALPVA
jgi:hypothetical protein